MKISAVIGAIAAICVAPAVALGQGQATSVPASSTTSTPCVTPSITPSPIPSSMPLPSRASTLLTLSTPCASVSDVPLPQLVQMAKDAQNAQDGPAATAFPFKRSHPRQVRPIFA